MGEDGGILYRKSFNIKQMEKRMNLAERIEAKTEKQTNKIAKRIEAEIIRFPLF